MTKITKTDRNAPPIAGAGDLFVADEKVDGRSTLARHYRTLFNDLALQLGDNLSPSETMLLRRAAMLALLCERDESAIVAGEKIDEDGYRKNTATLKGVLINLGMAVKSRDVKKSDLRMIDAHTSALMDGD